MSKASDRLKERIAKLSEKLAPMEAREKARAELQKAREAYAKVLNKGKKK